jgi:ubiquinone/menaquinone biosynthesis C-methylase UbiE
MVKTPMQQAPADFRDGSAEARIIEGAGDAITGRGPGAESTTHAAFVGSIPEIRRVGAAVPAGGKVLEVACGTGISTEHLWQALPAGAEILATDLNEAMIEYAREKRGALSNVTYRTADALALPFEDGAFDAVVCQFGIMFFPDKTQGIAEMARVLKPGGVLAFNVWDSLERNRVAEIALQGIAGFFETDPPDFLTVPFGHGDIDPIKDLLQRAGFAGIDIHVVTAEIERPDASHPARGFVEGNPGILQIRERATADPEAIVEAVAEAFEAAFGPAPLRIPLQEIVFTAVKP